MERSSPSQEAKPSFAPNPTDEVDAEGPIKNGSPRDNDPSNGRSLTKERDSDESPRRNNHNNNGYRNRDNNRHRRRSDDESGDEYQNEGIFIRKNYLRQ